jgi:hypothetical protein
MNVTLDAPKHRVSQFSGYTNYGFGYRLFETLAKFYRFSLYFDKPYTLAFILAKLFRWKRVWFHADPLFSVNIEPRGWKIGNTVPLSTAAWTVPAFSIEINIRRPR